MKIFFAKKKLSKSCRTATKNLVCGNLKFCCDFSVKFSNSSSRSRDVELQSEKFRLEIVTGKLLLNSRVFIASLSFRSPKNHQKEKTEMKSKGTTAAIVLIFLLFLLLCWYFSKSTIKSDVFQAQNAQRKGLGYKLGWNRYLSCKIYPCLAENSPLDLCLRIREQIISTRHKHASPNYLISISETSSVDISDLILSQLSISGGPGDASNHPQKFMKVHFTIAVHVCICQQLLKKFLKDYFSWRYTY